MNSIEYWEKRKAKRMFEYMGMSEDAALEIAKLYRKASMYTTQEMTQIFNRYKSKFGLSEAEAHRILNTLKDPNSLAELRKVLRNKELTAEHKEALELLEAPAYRARINRFQKLQDNIDSVMKNVYGQEKDFSTSHYIDLGYDAYYKSMFDIQKHVGLGFNFSQLNARDFDVLLNSNWSGSNYSQRIWENTEELAQRVKEELLVSLLTGRTERETAAIIQNEFDVGAYKARRLIRTESAFVAEEMEAKSYEECGAEKYRFIAVLDLKTSEICRAKDNQVFELSKRKTGVNYPPLHPWCRSTTCIYIDDETLEHMTRIAQDPITGKNIKVPANMSYKEWRKKYVPEEMHLDTKNKKKQVDIKDEELLADKPILSSLRKKVKGLLVDNKVVSYDELPEKIRVNFEDGLKNADPYVNKVLKSHMRETDYSIGFDASTFSHRNVIKLKNEDVSPSSLAHELFHMIDYKYEITKNDIFRKALEEDYKRIIKVSNGDVISYFYKKYPNAFFITKSGTIMSHEKYRGISDVMSGLSGDKIHFGYHHKEEYWKNDSLRLSKEAWAQYGRIGFDNDDEVFEMLLEEFENFNEIALKELKKIAKK